MSGMKRRSFVLTGAALLATRPSAAETLMAGGSKINIHIMQGDGGKDALIHGWIAKSAAAVTGYYGKFPVPAVDIVVEMAAGSRVGGGRTYPGEVPTIEIRAGRDADEDAFMRHDWVMVHEMIHLAFPWMNLRHNWMAEGLAVYVESVARARAGHVAVEQVWGDFVKSMPKGLPKPGEGGFDVTVNWGRTYWGGALFCLLADIAIRRDSANQSSLQTALRAINAVSDFRSEHPLRETLEIGDKATGLKVLAAQYNAMRDVAVMTDLAALWRDLGVSAQDGKVSLIADAPWSGIREAITGA
jgi:hypothetical protein